VAGAGTVQTMMRALRAPVVVFAAAGLLAGCASTITAVQDGEAPGGQVRVQRDTPRLAFAPLTGPPQPVADSLARSFAGAALARGLVLAPYRRRRSAYVVKGFISIVPGKNGTTAVYIWDVLSPDLKRLHRISGQSTDRASREDPWTALGPQTIDAIAETTLDQLALWLASR